MAILTTNALANAALPTLADSASLAAVAQGDLSRANEMLQVQLKLHLLTTEHLVVSHGFLYDNPAIWDMLDPQLTTHLTTERRDGNTTLLVQVNAAAMGESSVDADLAFRSWAFGDDGARHLEPSALRILGRAKGGAPSLISALNRQSSTLDDHAGVLALPNLRAAGPHIQGLINRCDVLPKPDNRYEVFHEHVHSFLDVLVEAQLKQLPGPFAALYGRIDKLREFLSRDEPISRSALEKFDADLWWQLAPYLNQFRLRGYLPSTNSGFYSYLPSPANEAVATLLQEASAGAEQEKEKWVVALDRLSFDDVFRIRAEKSFRNVLEELGAIWKGNASDAHERYCHLLSSKWRDELSTAVAAVAPNCVVDKNKGEGWWIPPVSQLTGFAAGATTLTVVGAAATGPVIGAVMLGVGGATYLSLLSAKKIADSFRVDKPELAAHLVAGKVIDSLPPKPARK